MKTTTEICDHLQRSRVLADMLPLERTRSVPFPVWVGGTPALAFLFYIDKGRPGAERQIMAPLARVLVDKKTGHLTEITLPPLLWQAGHSHETVLGRNAPHGLVGVSIEQAKALYADLHRLTDELCEAPEPASVSSDVVSRWRALFESLCVPGLAAYFQLEQRGYQYCTDPRTFARVSSTATGTHRQEAAASITPSSHPKVVASTPARSATGVYGLLDSLRNLLRENDEQALLRDLHRVGRMLADRDMSVAVVGEFSRGKSSLVNKLLGEELLPEGDLPTTALLTRVRAGNERVLSFVGTDKSQERKPFSQEEIERYRRSESVADLSGVLDVTLPSEWLATSGVTLIDTPGVGDLHSPDASTYEAVANCDGVLIVVAATSPLSLTEKLIVDEHVFRHAIPRVAFVVTKLDLIAADERAKLVQYVLDKATAWCPAAEVWVASDDAVHLPEGLHGKGLADIRHRLHAWGSDPERMKYRARQAASQLRALGRLFHTSLQSRMNLCDMDALQRADASRLARTRLNSEALVWEDIRLGFDKRAVATETWFKQASENAKGQLRERLTRELERTANPREWWLNDLSLKLTHEYRLLTRSMADSVTKRLHDDQEWLHEQIGNAFSINKLPQLSAVSLADNRDPAPAAPSQLADLKKYQIVGRIAGAAAGAGIMLLLAPTGVGPLIAGSLGTGLGTVLTDRFLGLKVQEQKNTLAKALATHLDAIAHALDTQARDGIRKAYAAVLEETRRLEGTWLRSELERISSTATEVPPFPRDSVLRAIAGVDKILVDLEEALA
jgi:GTPase SAR1 family protein